MDLPRIYPIRERSHRIINAFTPAKLEALGQALDLRPGQRILDLASGKGELLCTWARDHGITGTGVDISTDFVAAAHERAADLGVVDQVTFVHDDAQGFVSDPPVDVAACVGATWLGDGVAGTVELLGQSLRPGGVVLIGEPYWRMEPPDDETVAGCDVSDRDAYLLLPDLMQTMQELGWDLVEMVLADQDSWDRYTAAQWLNCRRWLDAHPDDVLAPEVRMLLTNGPVRYARYRREYLGWGVFALMRR